MPIGVDIAKNIIQVHYIDEGTGEIINKSIKRVKFIDFFANRCPCLIGIKACDVEGTPLRNDNSLQ